MIVWKLDELMRQRGIKGRELARRMNIGENYLSRVRHEVPDRLSLTLLDALCRELGCTIPDLLEYKVPSRGRKAAAVVVAAEPEAAPAKPAKPPGRAPKAAKAAPPPPDLGPEADDEEGSAFIADVLAPLFAELGPAAGIVEQAMSGEADAPPAEGAGVMTPPAEGPEAPEAAQAGGSAVLRTNALQARLERLKRLRQNP